MSTAGAAGDTAGAPQVLAAETVLTVETLSDWHVGSGGRRSGLVDVGVRRDSDGLPYLPGTTMTGVLRDACLTVARALDDGDPAGVWRRWHRYLFGDRPAEMGWTGVGWRPRPAVVGVGVARLPTALRAWLSVDQRLVRETTFVKPGVRIDRASGRAMDDMLRFVEMARAGLPLTAEVRLRLPARTDGADPSGTGADPGGPGADGGLAVGRAATVLLVLGAAWCDRIGGDRRRGAGLVRLSWAGQEPAMWARWLARSGWCPPDPPAAGQAPRPPVRRSRLAGDVPPEAAGLTPDEREPGPRAVVVELAIDCRGPVRVPRQVLGNVTVGHDHLPGAGLLAWLSSRWGEELVRAAVAANRLLVRHAYPEVDGRRGLPVPFSLFRVRRTGAVVNAAAAPLPDEPVRQVRTGWTLPDAPGGRLVVWEQPLAEATHNTVSRATQRPDGAGGVYAVEVLPAGSRLRTRIVVDAAVAHDLRLAFGPAWWERLAGPARMGARRSGEYGQVHVTVDAPAAPTAPGAGRPVPGPGEEFRVWAGSDLVIPSRSLRLAADPADLLTVLAARLNRHGGLTLGWAPDDDRMVAVTRTSRRDSWQGRWQLPRESIIGLAAGSVVVVQVTGGTVDPDDWADVMLTGIGERRAEGFGEIVLDAPLLRLNEPVAVSAPPGTTSGSAVEPAGPATGVSVAGTAPGALPAAVPDGGLSPAEREAARFLRGRAIVTACHDRMIILREDPDPPEGYRRLRAALSALSPSQRAGWLTLVNDAVLRRAETRLRGEIARWLAHQGAARDPQREAAARIGALLDGGIDTVLAVDGLDPSVRPDALAVVLGDLVDAARRPTAPTPSTTPTASSGSRL